MTTIIGLLLALTVTQNVLFNFEGQENLSNWMVVNDDVMGGRSKASMQLSNNGTAVFSGQVSLENNGGFSSIRYRMDNVPTKNHEKLVLRLKGDGKNYQVRIRENDNDYFSYIYTFSTQGKWETIEVPLAEMYPSFRGRKLNRPNYNGETAVEMTFLIANKKAESFKLELQNAYLY